MSRQNSERYDFDLEASNAFTLKGEDETQIEQSSKIEIETNRRPQRPTNSHRSIKINSLTNFSFGFSEHINEIEDGDINEIKRDLIGSFKKNKNNVIPNKRKCDSVVKIKVLKNNEKNEENNAINIEDNETNNIKNNKEEITFDNDENKENKENEDNNIIEKENEENENNIKIKEDIIKEELGKKEENDIKEEENKEETKEENKEVIDKKSKVKKKNKAINKVKNLDDIMNSLNLKYIEPPKKERIGMLYEK